MIKKILLSWCIAVLFSGLSLFASELNWIEKSNSLPANQGIEELAMNSSGVIFAATMGQGLYKSMDGENWEHLSGLNVNYARAVLVAVNDDLYVGDTDGNVYKSTDDGITWDKIYSLTGSFNMINCIYQSASGKIYFVSGEGGVYVSGDNGANWDDISGELGSGIIWSVTVNQNDDIFVSTMSSGIYRKPNNGGTWEQINEGLNGTDVHTLEIDVNGDIYAGLSGGDGICMSTDNGDTWTDISYDLKQVFYDLLFVDGVLFAGAGGGVYRFSGEGWEQNSSGMPGDMSVKYLLMHNTGYMYAASNNGKIYRSETPLIVNENLIRVSISPDTKEVFDWEQEYSFEITVLDYLDNPVEGAEIEIYDEIRDITDYYYTDSEGQYSYSAIVPQNTESKDYTITFFVTKEGYMDYQTIRDIEINHGNADELKWKLVETPTDNTIRSLFISSSGYYFYGTGGNGVYRSSDKGQNWEAKNNGMAMPINSIYVFREDSQGNLYIPTDWDGLMMSTDNGDKWSTISADNDRVKTVEVAGNDKLIMVDYENKISESTNKGGSWKEISPGFEIGNIVSVRFINSNLLYIIGTDATAVSYDNGESWLKDQAIPEGIYFKDILNNNGVLYACAGEAGLYQSNNSGNSWSLLYIQEAYDFKRLKMDEEANLYAAVSGKGILKSTNSGTDWIDYNEGLPDMTYLDLFDMVIDSDGYIFASTFDRNLYKRKISGSSVTVELYCSVMPKIPQTGDWGSEFTFTIIVSDSNEFVIGDAALSIVDFLYGASQTLFTDSGGELVYTSIVPNYTEDGDYNIEFQAMANDLTSEKVIRTITVLHQNAVDEQEQGRYFNIAPNPARGMMTLNIRDTEYQGTASLNILGLSGKRLISVNNIEINPGDNNIPVNISSLVPGVYIINLNIGQDILISKIIVK